MTVAAWDERKLLFQQTEVDHGEASQVRLVTGSEEPFVNIEMSTSDGDDNRVVLTIQELAEMSRRAQDYLDLISISRAI